MKKGCLLIIAAVMLLVPVVTYSCPSTTETAEGHGPSHGSMTGTPSDKVADQPMSEMNGMKSDKAVNKPMTDAKQEKMTHGK